MHRHLDDRRANSMIEAENQYPLLGSCVAIEIEMRIFHLNGI